MSLNFGEFIAKKRKEGGITLRGMADALEIAAPYLSDIEKGRKNPPSLEMLEKMSTLLTLSSLERDEMFDLAGDGKNQVSPDLPSYIMDLPEARTALRRARDQGKDADFWNQVTESLMKEE